MENITVTTLRARTLEGEATDLEIKDVERLRSGLQGPLLQPGEHGYDGPRTIWNGMIDRRPALIARCIGVADVMNC